MVPFNKTCPSNLLVKAYPFYTEIQVESVWVVIQNTIIEENVIANKQQAPTSKDNSLSSHLSSLKYF